MAKPKGRPRKPQGEGTQVRIEPDLATMARYVAAVRGVTLLELLSGYIRPLVVRDFRQVAPNVGEDR